jgi:hypothetical protein
MTAKIIRLERPNFGCRHQANGVCFPRVYRVTGLYYDFRDGEGLMSSDRPSEPLYSLSNDTDVGIANATITPICCLDPAIDEGWIIIRHHRTESHMEGYLDAMSESPRLVSELARQMVWRTSEGIFSLLCHPGVAGKRGHALAYVTKVPIDRGPCSGMLQDVYHVVYPDGTAVLDPDLMMPDDISD